MKLFSTKLHGVLDYVTVAALPIAARLLKADPKTQQFMDISAATVLGYSLLTRYELGVAPILSMEGHLASDAVFGTAMLAAPSLLNIQDKKVQSALIGFGLFAYAAAALTETKSPQEIAEEGPSLGDAYRAHFPAAVNAL